jgi:hypothetical protein
VSTHHIDVAEVGGCPNCHLTIRHVSKVDEVDAICEVAKRLERSPRQELVDWSLKMKLK